MVENQHSPEEEPVCTTWARLVEVVLGLFLIVGTGVMAHYYAPPAPLPVPAPAPVRPVLANDHQDELRQLTRDVDELKQEQAMPALVLNRYRNSICYIYGIYQVSMPGHRPALRARISGTGFVVAEGLLATNRHVAEPWYGDAEADALISKGAKPELEKLVAFFPGFPLPVDITPLVLSAQRRSGGAARRKFAGHQPASAAAAGREGLESGRTGRGSWISHGRAGHGGEIAAGGLRTPGLPPR